MVDFSSEINEKFDIETIIPEKGESFVITADRVIEASEKIKSAVSYKRLAIIDILETLKEEIDELSDIIMVDLKKEKSDIEVDELRAKLKNIEKSIVETLK
jgi:metallo-beta-lactamase family protein